MVLQAPTMEGSRDDVFRFSHEGSLRTRRAGQRVLFLSQMCHDELWGHSRIYRMSWGRTARSPSTIRVNLSPMFERLYKGGTQRLYLATNPTRLCELARAALYFNMEVRVSGG